jgi:hypothetical protein
MTDTFHDETSSAAAGGLPRRQALVQSTAGVATLACTLGGCATSAKVQGNTPQAAVGYQDHPSGLERCGVCKHFIALHGCEIAAAPVQANGWCKAYALF